jgi:hypothetical protein
MIPGCADNAMRSPKSTAAIIPMALPAPLTIRQNGCHTSLAGDCGATRRGFNPANARQQEGPLSRTHVFCAFARISRRRSKLSADQTTSRS